MDQPMARINSKLSEVCSAFEECRKYREERGTDGVDPIRHARECGLAVQVAELMHLVDDMAGINRKEKPQQKPHRREVERWYIR